MSGKKKFYRALTIAGSDSGGGAGVQADLKTFTVLGVYGTSVFTALTAQNTTGVRSIHEVPPSFVEDQLNAVLEDIGTDATKIGMLFSPEIIEVVAKSLSRFGLEHVVLDPVMVAKGGSRLLKSEAVAAMKERIFPLAEIVTPNLPEA
ncbi:MAG TPA: bifunctional hydroxymethylpyrimidine kinase/phosphomethylpyrimidine kinase, partial [Bdellovibrionota bacterium]